MPKRWAYKLEPKMLTDKMIQAYLAKRVLEEVTKTAKPRENTICALVLAAFHGRADSGGAILRIHAKDARETAVKKLLIAAGFPNGTASTYSKVADGLLQTLIKRHGTPSGGKEGVSQFWAVWRDATSPTEQVKPVHDLFQELQTARGGRFMDLCDEFDIPYAGNATQLAKDASKAEKDAAPKPEKSPREKTVTQEVIEQVVAAHTTPAPLHTWQDVLAAMMALPAKEQAALINAYQAAMHPVATPAQIAA